MNKSLAVVGVLAMLSGCATERSEGPTQNPLTAAPNSQRSSNNDDAKRAEPNWTEAAQKRLSLAMQYLDQGKPGSIARAKTNFDLAMKYKPSLPEVQFGMGYYYQRVNEPVQAETYFKKALSLDSRDPRAHNIYGVFLCEQNRFDEADEHFQDAVAAKEYNQQAGTYENAGLCALKAGKKDRAKLYFDKAVYHNPEQGRALVELGNLAMEAGDTLTAGDYLRAYQRNNRPSASSLWLGIRVARITGDRNARDSYGMLLTQQFAGSEEAKLYQQSQ